MSRWLCIVVCIAACGPRPRPLPASTVPPDAAVDPCAIADAGPERSPHDAFSFEYDIIEGCLLHPEGIVD